MSVYRREAENAEEVAKLLRTRGRIIISGPARCGKTTELIRYAEERYPNGRFAVVVAREEDKKNILRLHWNVSNGLSHVDIVAKRLLGEPLKGEDVNEPIILAPSDYATGVYFSNHFIPVFCDDWNLLPKAAQRHIMKHRLFIAAVTTKGANDAEEES